MRGSFPRCIAIFAILIAFLCTPAHAEDLCAARDDKGDLAAVEKFFDSALKEHQGIDFSRTIKQQSLAKARAFYLQDIVDRKTELCADRLRLAEDIKKAPAQYATGDCAAAAVVSLADSYMHKVASAYDANVTKMSKLQGEHIRDLKLGLFAIAKGSTRGLETVNVSGASLPGAPREARFDWVKGQASKLAPEVHLAWGAVRPQEHPLVQLNLAIAREAVAAKRQRDALRARFHSDGHMPTGCRKKP